MPLMYAPNQALWRRRWSLPLFPPLMPLLYIYSSLRLLIVTLCFKFLFQLQSSSWPFYMLLLRGCLDEPYTQGEDEGVADGSVATAVGKDACFTSSLSCGVSSSLVLIRNYEILSDMNYAPNQALWSRRWSLLISSSFASSVYIASWYLVPQVSILQLQSSSWPFYMLLLRGCLDQSHTQGRIRLGGCWWVSANNHQEECMFHMHLHFHVEFHLPFMCWSETMKLFLFRSVEVWQELQTEVDELPAAWHQARPILPRRGADDHPPARLAGQPVVRNCQPPPPAHWQRD